MEQLRAALASDEQVASTTAIQGTMGPDLPGIPGALPLMIAADEKFPSARYELMIALGNLDADELRSQKDALALLVERYVSRRPMGADVEARERPMSVVRGVSR